MGALLLSQPARRGSQLILGLGRCRCCHGEALFPNLEFHDPGLEGEFLSGLTDLDLDPTLARPSE